MFTEPKIAPSILSADFMNMARDVAEIEEGGAAFVHVDVMDGHFVPNLTLGVPFVAGLKKITKLPLDVHLMISNPLEQLPWYLEHTPDIVTEHAEALNADAGQFDLAIDMIHDAGCKAAIGGIGMLLWQGVAAYKLFTGKDMPAQEVLEKFFS